MVIALSPALIMALVGSLCFFLIEIFYRGRMEGSARWVMFWFVIAIVLVARIAIEKSSEHAALYGLALAVAVWIYLARMQPAYLPCVALLAIVWFCAHKLVWNCTLIDEDEDSSGQGLLQNRAPPAPEPKSKSKRKRAAPGSPGLWVVYFSLAALPLFGVGQALLPAGAAGSRRAGLVLVVLYMSAALGLLMTTSFLGLRRYLRQRYLRMPATVALSWLKLGGGVAFVILASALLLPRPGASQVWTVLRHQMDNRLRQASQYAAGNNPSGKGEGRAGNETGGRQGETKTPASGQPSTAPAQSPPASNLTGQAAAIYPLLRAAFMFAAAFFAGWWLFRCRHLLLEIARSLFAAIAGFFQNLLDLRPRRRPAAPREAAPPRSKLRPLSEYKNPFYAGRETIRQPAEIIIYTYDFVQAWAREQGVEPNAHDTAREFCRDMAERWPGLAGPYRQLAFLYAHAAYGRRLPAHCDLEPLKELWRQLTWEQTGVSPAR